MLPALGAASSALDLLKSLTSTKSSSPQSTGATQNSQTLDFFGSTESPGLRSPTATPKGSSSKSGALSPDLMRALLAALGQTNSSTDSSSSTSSSSSGASDPLKELFAALDGDGDGKISKSEFEDKLGAGGTNTENADSVFSKIDRDGDGSVSLGEMMSALKGKGHRHHHDASADGSGAAGQSGSDPLPKALQGASATSVTNGDGSTTTSLTYADGSTVTLTSPASGAATSSYNFIERLIARQASAISSAASASLSVSA